MYARVCCERHRRVVDRPFPFVLWASGGRPLGRNECCSLNSIRLRLDVLLSMNVVHRLALHGCTHWMFSVFAVLTIMRQIRFPDFPSGTRRRFFEEYTRVSPHNQKWLPGSKSHAQRDAARMLRQQGHSGGDDSHATDTSSNADPDADPDGTSGNDDDVVVCQDLSGRLSAPVTGDFYVTRSGNDTRDGKTRETAFATIQHAVNVLGPGQTLVVGPGEYFGAIVASHLGNMDVDTVIRAEIPGTVILRGDMEAPVFQPLPGFQRVYVADFASDENIQAINELDSLKGLSRVPNIPELEYSAGRFYQDRAAHKLYLSTSDTKPADQHFYTLSVIGTHGLYLDTPQRVCVEGLTATGFNNCAGVPYEQQTLWATYGIFIKNGRQSVLSNCQAYLNGRGIGSSNEYDLTSGGNLITGCRAGGTAAWASNTIRGASTCCIPDAIKCGIPWLSSTGPTGSRCAAESRITRKPMPASSATRCPLETSKMTSGSRPARATISMKTPSPPAARATPTISGTASPAVAQPKEPTVSF